MIDSFVFNNLPPRSSPSRQKSANSRPFVFNHLRTLVSLFCSSRQVISFIFNHLRTLYTKHRGVPLSAIREVPAHA